MKTMDEHYIQTKVNDIIEWFIKKHSDWVEENKLISWAKKLGIILNNKGKLDEDSLFHLFILGVLWNSPPTYKAEKGEDIFRKIKNTYTLTSFRDAHTNRETREMLIQIAREEIGNKDIFNLLYFVVNGNLENQQCWTNIINILTSKTIGDKDSDVNRLKHLYNLFNSKRSHNGKAYLTKKIFLIFREIRIQFMESEKLQYHPSICCIPDNHVQRALGKLGFTKIKQGYADIEDLLKASEIVANYFCNSTYELYDLPLFFADRENCLNFEKNSNNQSNTTNPVESGEICPQCGSRLVWRKSKLTGELYRGCTNFKGGCRWNNRSY